VQSIAASFRFCLNLVIVHVTSDNVLTAQLANLALTRVCVLRRKLRCFTAYISDVLPFGAQALADSIEVLGISPTPLDLRYPGLTFSRLHTLHVSHLTVQYIAQWRLPSLSTLCILAEQTSSWNRDYKPFLKAHGARILRLDVTQLDTRDIRYVARYYTSAAHITASPGMFKYFEALFPKLECVEINMANHANPSRSIYAVNEGINLLYEKRDVQKFKLLRLIEWDLSDFWKRPWTAAELGMWRSWIEKAKSGGVEFVFDCGTPVKLPAILEPSDVLVQYPQLIAELTAEGNESP
jgi:hypothetical protein